MYQTEMASQAEQIASESSQADGSPKTDGSPRCDESLAVEIYDQVYRLRGIDAAYLEHLAGVVDSKMRAVSASGTVDSLRVAVLASLNIADELEVLRERYAALAASGAQAQMLTQTAVRTRSQTLAQMLDQVFDECEAAPIRRAG